MDNSGPLESWTSMERQIGALLSGIFSWMSQFIQPSGLLQLAVIAAAAGVAWFGGGRLEPAFEAWVRRRDTIPLRRMRFYALILRRTRPILFVLVAFAAVATMRQILPADRSHVVLVVANLVGAWVIVSITSRFIRNRLLARIVAVLAWLIAAANILHLSEPAVSALDAAAVTVGKLRISLLLLLKAGLVLTVLLWLASTASTALEKRLFKVEDMSPAMRVLTGKLARIALLALAALVGIQSIGLDLSGFAVFSGAVGLGLGFGLQKVVSNLVSGIILLVDQSIKPGDVISLGETFGWIIKLNARYVSVITRDGREFLIPNEDLVTGRVINWSYSDKNIRLEIPFGVSYASDLRLVQRIAIEAARQPTRVLRTPPAVCHLSSLGDSSVNFLLRFWIADPSGGVTNVRSEVLFALWDALKANHIEIPFPQRDLHLKTPYGASALTLAQRSAGAEAVPQRR
jgi:small-conductance mechanosensitive channel